MSRRPETSGNRWTATMQVPSDWVVLPPRRQRSPLFTRGPYLGGAKRLLDQGLISRLMIRPTAHYLEISSPLLSDVLFVAARVEGTKLADAVFSNGWIVGVGLVPWTSVEEMAEAVGRSEGAQLADAPPVEVSCPLGPALGARKTDETTSGRIKELCTTWVWLRDQGRTVIVVGSYEGPHGASEDRFAAELDGMLATLEVGWTGDDPPP